MHRNLLPLALLAALLGACGETPPPATKADPASPPAATAADAPTVNLPAAPATEAEIRAEDLAAQIEIIASDEFAGRQ
mgnify:CR=1 FL=1